MLQEQLIYSQEVVQIRNVKTGCYLTGTGFAYAERGFLFGQTHLANYSFVVGNNDSLNHYSLWKIVKLFEDQDNVINYGDFIFLKNVSTKSYLSYEFEKQSDVTQQVRVTTTEKKMDNFPLYISQISFIPNCKQYNLKSGEKIKFQTTKLNSFLQCSNKNYIPNSVNQYKEICCSKEGDENNQWEIIKLTKQQREGFDIQEIIQIKQLFDPISDSDKVIIRNFQTGYSLHSHKTKYASTGLQEVTCYAYERDLNDWWVIQQYFQMANSTIFDQVPIKLVHQQTIWYLTADLHNLAKSKNGHQIRCTQNDQQQQFIISTIDNQQLAVGKPFYMFFQILNKYLCQGPELSEMQKTQYEVILSDKFTSRCLWIIEKKIK